MENKQSEVVKMPRNMSFMLTTEQIRKQTKTVTRRLGWKFLKPGTILNACEKCMGLKKGEKIKKLGRIRVIDVRTEPLCAITKDEVIKEGFPEMARPDFIMMFVNHYKDLATDAPVTRIEFEYLDPPTASNWDF
jgi:hypothetical protein